MAFGLAVVWFRPSYYEVFFFISYADFFFLLAVVLLSFAVVRWAIGASFSILFGL